MPRYLVVLLREIAEPPAPVRAAIDEGALMDLADSIREVGLLQPLIVVEVIPGSVGEKGAGGENPQSDAHAHTDGSGAPGTVHAKGVLPSTPGAPARYVIVAGHRRYLAARYLQLESVPCMVYADGNLAQEAAMLHENVYREGLSAAEEGAFYAELIAKHDLTEDALCKMVRQKPNYIYDRLALITGDRAVLAACAEHKIAFAVARELNKCRDDSQRHVLLDMVLKGGASASVVRQWVQRANSEAAPQAAPVGEAPGGEAQAAPTLTTLACAFCGQTKAPFNLRPLMVCFYELDQIAAILAAQGVAVSECWPKGQ